MENVAVPAVGNLSKEELLKLKEAMNAKAAREQVMICPMVMHPAMIKEFKMKRRSGTVRNALIKLEKVGFLGKRFNSVVNSSLEGISAILIA